ncbi:hypothetical protein FRC05_007546 [Tulasnella sp. 425]|nr:hypothetical protein FRC05_007546 [Tulasnella sp. 425]
MALVVNRKRHSTDDQEFVRIQRPRVDVDNTSAAVGGILVITADDIVFESLEPFNLTGHFSDLFVGHYKGKSKVALKRPRIARNGETQDAIQKFEQEAQVWRLLRHPHILEFIGIYKAGGHMYLVSPFIENGTLAEYIAAHPDTDRPRFLFETANALAYLHAMKIVHGDVKANNILVSADLRALICDFGLAKWMPSITSSQSKGAGTVLSGKMPFSELLVDGAVIRAVLEGARPRPVPTHSHTGESYQRIWNIAARCWQREPNARPTMKQIFESFIASPVAAGHDPDDFDYTPSSSLNAPRETIPTSLRSTPEAAWPDPDPPPTEGTNWITFTPAPGRQVGKFQPAKATNQAYGAFSDVKMCEVIYENGKRETAALKRLRPVRLGSQAENTNDIDRERFEREILVWAGIWHPNVAPLLGFTLSPAFYLISPWYPNGTIRQYISTNPGCDRLYLIQDVAAGLAYLHTCQPPIVHGDIKSNNVVVDADGHAKIIDFGLSQILENSTTEANTVIEGLQLVARPASLKPVTNRTTYSRIPADNPLWSLLFSCWEEDPVTRPSMTDLQMQLRGLISSRALLGHSPRASPSSSGSSGSTVQASGDAPSSLLLSIKATVTGQSSSEWSAFFQTSGLPAGRYRRLGSQMLGCGVLSDSWLCEMERDGEVQQVAAKELRFARESTEIFRRALEGLERDARTWMAFKHPNIVPVLGYTFEQSFLLLRHWCPNGNIRDYLKRKPESNRLRLMYDATCGLSYIHSQTPPIVHGNIRPENVLIDADGQARIVDCGISKVAEEMPTFHTSMVKVDCRWIAPELALGDGGYRMSSSSDVYSLGCLALEVRDALCLPPVDHPVSSFPLIVQVIAEKQPYADYRTNKGVTDAMSRDEQPLPANQDLLWPQERIGKLWTACWVRDPVARPSAEELRTSLESMLR